jgi:hypothetical protein
VFRRTKNDFLVGCGTLIIEKIMAGNGWKKLGRIYFSKKCFDHNPSDCFWFLLLDSSCVMLFV